MIGIYMYLVLLMRTAPVAQLVRAVVLWAAGRGFKPLLEQYYNIYEMLLKAFHNFPYAGNEFTKRALPSVLQRQQRQSSHKHLPTLYNRIHRLSLHCTLGSPSWQRRFSNAVDRCRIMWRRRWFDCCRTATAPQLKYWLHYIGQLRKHTCQ